MKPKVYQYEKCSTCRKALKFLDERGAAYEAVPIVETPPSIAELREMLKRVGSLKKLFNTSGELYRELKISLKLPSMSEGEALELLSKHGKLVKRPFALVGQAGLVGFDETQWRRAFPSTR